MKAAFVQFSAGRTGSTFSGLLAVKAMLESGLDVDVIFAEPGEMISAYESLGCSTQVIPHKSAFRSIKSHLALRNYFGARRDAEEFSKAFELTRPDLVYINTSVSLAAAMGANTVGVPVLWHLREMTSALGGEIKVPNRLFAWGLSRLFKKHAAALIAISKAVAIDLLGQEDSPGLSIVPNAVTDKYFEATAAAMSLEIDGTIVGVPGTLRPMKGHEFLINAAVEVARSDSACQFVVTGDGESGYVAKLRSRVIELGLEDRVHFIGTVIDMIGFYDACDLIVIPSRQEPFGRTAIEAFARKRAVIASAVGGLCETISDGDNGVLVEYGNAKGLSAAIVGLANDKAKRDRLADSGFHHARERYTETVHKQCIKSVVQSVLGP